jgi:hypothetical protein
LTERKERNTTSEKVGWRPKEWGEAVGGLSRVYVYTLINSQKIKTVHIGKARVITTSPSEFLASIEAA